jgi:hypothetical protein
MQTFEAMEVVGLIPGFGGEGRAALTGGLALLLALQERAVGERRLLAVATVDTEALAEDPLLRARLAALIRPVVLRRRKAEVAPELPARTERTELLPLGHVVMDEAESTVERQGICPNADAVGIGLSCNDRVGEHQ